MGPVCLHCGLVGASYEADHPCERRGCNGHYRQLSFDDERRLISSFGDVPLRPRKTWNARRDEAMRPVLEQLREERGGDPQVCPHCDESYEEEFHLCRGDESDPIPQEDA